MESIPVGARIVSKRPLRDLHGFYLGRGRVVLESSGPAAVLSLAAFAGGHPVCVLEHPDRELPVEHIVRRALGLAKNEGYHPRTYGRVKNDTRILTEPCTATTGSGVKPTTPAEEVAV